MLRGVAKITNKLEAQVAQLYAYESTTVMSVAPSDMAVYTRVYYDQTGTTRNSGDNSRARGVQKIVVPIGSEAVRSVTPHDRALDVVTMGLKSPSWNCSKCSHTGNGIHPTPPHIKRINKLIHFE